MGAPNFGGGGFRGGDRGGDRDFRGGDRDFRGGDRDFRGGDRGGDRDFRGGDRDYRDRDRPEPSVKGRLRAKARKKARKQRKGSFQRRKVCRFCVDSHVKIDYKDQKTLRLFVSETGKMIPRRISGNCARHQRPLALAVKRARQLALLPLAGQPL